MPGEIDIVSADLTPKTVRVAAERINAKLGTSLSAEEMVKYLNSVFIPTKLENGDLVCDIPSFRGDISLGDDIAEEVARMFGYNNIPTTPMTGAVRRGVYSEEEACTDKARRLLVHLGCYECHLFVRFRSGLRQTEPAADDKRLRSCGYSIRWATSRR